MWEISFVLCLALHFLSQKLVTQHSLRVLYIHFVTRPLYTIFNLKSVHFHFEHTKTVLIFCYNFNNIIANYKEIWFPGLLKFMSRINLQWILNYRRSYTVRRCHYVYKSLFDVCSPSLCDNLQWNHKSSKCKFVQYTSIFSLYLLDNHFFYQQCFHPISFI